MDFDCAKENIQPLSSGRNATLLQAALNSNPDLNIQRESYELAIREYEGEDPLEPWFEYILWIEQSNPSGGNELKKVLLKCLETFETEERYFQDRRMVRIYIKFIDSEIEPQALYEELYNAGVGTMVADLYICWAFYYDLLGNFSKTEKIFQLGLRAKAQPYDDLKEAHIHFGFTMSQRILHQDDDDTSKEDILSSIRERRNALTSLKFHRKTVGSIRTGAAVKSYKPGRIQTDANKQVPNERRNNENIEVYEDQNSDPNIVLPDEPKSIVRNIIDSARKQENMHEPGPWNNHKVKQKGRLFNQSNTLNFEIMEDDVSDKNVAFLPHKPNNYAKGINLPSKFAIKNFPQSNWLIKHVTETEILPNAIPMYPKFYCYPNTVKEFALEEYWGYLWFKKHKPDHSFIKKYLNFWDNDYSTGIRLYPNYPKWNIPDKHPLELSEFNPSEYSSTMIADVNQLYKNKDEKQMEEIFAEEWIKRKQQKGECTILGSENIDETVCGINNDNAGIIFPSRKSMAPAALMRNSVYFARNDFRSEELSEKKNVSKLDHQGNINVQQNVIYEQKNIEEIQENVQNTSSKISSRSGISNNNTDFNQFNQDFVHEKTDIQKILEQPKTDINFQKSETNVESADFKVPAPRKSLRPKAPFVIYQDDEETAETFFAPNETFSTLIFNSNIKMQSVSTPNKVSSNIKVEEFKQPDKDTVESPIPKRVSVAPEILGAQKQLSIIMETSETNTKSSVETQLSDDSSKSKPYPSAGILPKDITLGTILEKRSLGAIPKDLSYHTLKDDKKLDIDENYSKSIVTPDLQRSIKIFEDKTTTMTKITLTKAQDLGVNENKFSILEDSRIFHESTANIKHVTDSDAEDIHNGKSLLTAKNMTGYQSKLDDLTLPELELSHTKLKSTQRDSYESIYDFLRTSPTSEAKQITEQLKVNKDKKVGLEFDQSLTFPKINLKKLSDAHLPISNNEHLDKNQINYEIKSTNLADSSAKTYLINEGLTNIKNPLNSSSKNITVENNFLLPKMQDLNLSCGQHKSKLSTNYKMNNYDDFHVSQIQEKSLHIKTEIIEDDPKKTSLFSNLNTDKPRKSILKRFSEIKSENLLKNNSTNKIITDDIEKSRIEELDHIYGDIEMNDEQSIYYTHTPKLQHVWRNDDDDINDRTCNFFSTLQAPPDIDYANPFSPHLIKAFLTQIDFLNYLTQIGTCIKKDNIMPLHKFPNISINNKNLNVVKIIGKGSFGTVFCAKDKDSGKLYALKQQKPANLWEYYICLELNSRIKNLDIAKCFMNIDSAIIANNSSIFLTEFSKFGCLITVCNKIKRVTTRNVNEYVVMILSDQILSIIDHLHSSHMIHADLKADNILLMNEINYDTSIPVIKLIDFGVSIDMDLFPAKQTFNFKHVKDDVHCIEMRENNPWTYQIDLYGIAGIIHVLLFGKYMVAEKKSLWQPNQNIPRYFNKLLWETIFTQLLNIRDCNSLPNLQDLRKLLKEELSSKERFVMDKIKEFNMALDQK